MGDSWSTPLPARHLAGPGASKRAEVPNVLFLPDGFRQEQAELFYKILSKPRPTNSRRADGGTDRINRLLRQDRLNAFAAFVKSMDPGGSVLYEIAYLSDRKIAASDVKLPEANGDTDVIDQREELIFAVGLPVPDDAPHAESQAAAAVRVRDKFLAVYPDLFTTRLSVSKFLELYPNWARHARTGFASPDKVEAVATRPLDEQDVPCPR